ncbi:MAG TPA: hypothetical protein PK587_09765 [Syntrophales bacterium]|nr:hypothetical protein [Syntrophales bacterium]
MLFRLMEICLALLVIAGVLFPGSCAAAAGQADEDARAAVVRISPADAYEEVASGRALLVCAYPDVEVCEKVLLKDSISLKEFESRVPELKKTQEVIFYCA